MLFLFFILGKLQLNRSTYIIITLIRIRVLIQYIIIKYFNIFSVQLLLKEGFGIFELLVYEVNWCILHFYHILVLVELCPCNFKFPSFFITIYFLIQLISLKQNLISLDNLSFCLFFLRIIDRVYELYLFNRKCFSSFIFLYFMIFC